MNNPRIRYVASMATIGTLTLAGSLAAAMPASAAPSTDPVKNAQGQCLATPSHYDLVNHDEVFHFEDVTIPGEDAVTHDEQRWSREVPGVDEVSHDETKFFRIITGQDAVTHEQWKYKHFVPGLEELSHLEYQFSRTNPGQQEKSHQEWQFSRTNPGQQEKSHQEYKYQKSETQYRFRTRVHRPDKTVERKYVKGYDFVEGGTTRVNGQTVSGHWVQSSGWHAIPDSVINAYWGTGGVPSQYLGGSEDHPKGTVNLSVYGGPSTNVSYYASLVTIKGEYTDWGPWSGWSTTNPGGDTATRDVESKEVVTPYNNGNWTTDTPGAPWVKVDERKVIDQAGTAPFTEYRKADGSASTNQTDAGWFTQSSFAGWNQFNHKSVLDQEYIAPFTEYRAQDGSATTNVGNAGWFTQSSFAGWNQYGSSKKVIDQAATADQTFYLTRDAQGNLGQSTNEADASWFESASGVDTTTWTEFGRETVTDQEEVPDKTVYLTQAQDSTLGETEDVNQASWVRTDITLPNTPIWDQMVDEHGDPLSRKVVDSEAIPGYTEYYLPNGGAPTRDLTDANWTEDEPQGWTFVDSLLVVDKEAIPPTTTKVKVVDQEAWTENKFVPATYEQCKLAQTGTELFGPASLALLLMGVGTAGIIVMKRRGRHLKVDN